MIAVLGSDIKTLESLINKLDKNGVCEIANDNSVGQIIVSGDIKSINSFKKLLDDTKIKKYSSPSKCSISLFTYAESFKRYGRKNQ